MSDKYVKHYYVNTNDISPGLNIKIFLAFFTNASIHSRVFIITPLTQKVQFCLLVCEILSTLSSALYPME